MISGSPPWALASTTQPAAAASHNGPPRTPLDLAQLATGVAELLDDPKQRKRLPATAARGSRERFLGHAPASDDPGPLLLAASEPPGLGRGAPRA
jgi:hypothetical protein